MKYLLLILTLLILPATNTLSYHAINSTSQQIEAPPLEKKSAKKKHRKRYKKFRSKKRKKLFREQVNKGMLAGGIVLVIFGSIFLVIGSLFMIALLALGSSTIVIFALIGLLGGIGMLVPGIILISKSRKSGRVTTTKREDVIYLNNGSILRGKIIEINHPETVKIELAGGSVMVIDYDDVDRIESK